MLRLFATEFQKSTKVSKHPFPNAEEATWEAHLLFKLLMASTACFHSFRRFPSPKGEQTPSAFHTTPAIYVSEINEIHSNIRNVNESNLAFLRQKCRAGYSDN